MYIQYHHTVIKTENTLTVKTPGLCSSSKLFLDTMVAVALTESLLASRTFRANRELVKFEFVFSRSSTRFTWVLLAECKRRGSSPEWSWKPNALSCKLSHKTYLTPCSRVGSILTSIPHLPWNPKNQYIHTCLPHLVLMWQLTEEILPLPEIKLQPLSNPSVTLLMLIPGFI